MTNTDLAGASDMDLLLRRATELVADSPRFWRTDGISWLQRNLRIGYHTASRLMNDLVALGQVIRMPEANGYSYLKAGNGEIQRVRECNVLVLSDQTITELAALRKWSHLLLGLDESELHVGFMRLPDRSATALFDALRGEEWDYIVVDATNPESAPLQTASTRPNP